MTEQPRPAERAGRAGAPVLTEHNEFTCPGCSQSAEYRIARDVYGCDAGRNCSQATPEQRVEFEKQIAERLDAWRQNPSKES